MEVCSCCGNIISTIGHAQQVIQRLKHVERLFHLFFLPQILFIVLLVLVMYVAIHGNIYCYTIFVS